MKNAIVVLILALFSFPIGPSQAQLTPPPTTGFPAESSVIVGPGLAELRINGEPDANGLVWDIREPERSFEAWTVMVYNANDEAVSNVVATLEIMIDGEWYLANMDANEQLMTPPIIGPGEFGFSRMGDIGGAAEPWNDARIAVDSINAPYDVDVVSLDFRDVRTGVGENSTYSGTFVNTTPHTVTDLILEVGCVEDGRLVETFFFVSDLLQLHPGSEEAFELSDPFRFCEPSAEQFVTASAVRR